MYVWFPAAWMPLVVDAVRAKNVWWDRLGSQQGAVAFVDPRDAPLPETRELKYKYKKWPMDEEGHSPISDIRANVAHIGHEDVLPLLPSALRRHS